MKKVFEPNKIEKKWYSFWENNNLFSPKTSSNKKTFSIMLPPPMLQAVFTWDMDFKIL